MLGGKPADEKLNGFIEIFLYSIILKSIRDTQISILDIGSSVLTN